MILYLLINQWVKSFHWDKKPNFERGKKKQKKHTKKPKTMLIPCLVRRGPYRIVIKFTQSVLRSVFHKSEKYL